LDQTLFRNYFISEPLDLVQFLYHVGLQKLNEILPYESRTPGQERHADGALLFLAYPLQIIQGELAETVVNEVVAQLSGDYGIKRYLGDSYWMADYKNLFSEESRTADFSDDVTDY
jgi:phosphorylase kinase alpha/beta subunit